MGFSVTAAHVVFGFALLTAASVAVGSYWKTQAHVEESRRMQDERAIRQAHTNITIVGTPSYDGGAQTYEFQVKNVGSVGLDFTLFEYLVDGRVHADLASGYPLLNGASTTSKLLLPGDTLTVRLANVTSSPTDLKVTTENGISAYAT